MASARTMVSRVREALKDKRPLNEVEKALVKHWSRCPKCKSDQVSASDYDGGMSLDVKVTCEECEFTWYEHYYFYAASAAEEDSK